MGRDSVVIKWIDICKGQKKINTYDGAQSRERYTKHKTVDKKGRSNR